MSSNPKRNTKKAIRELLIVTVSESEYCIDIYQTLGINRVIPLTEVPKSPQYLRGIINLRGQVVTVIDLGVKLGGEAIKVSPQNRIIIVQDQLENVGLLVDKVLDVIQIESEDLEPPPANLGGELGRFFEGVYRDDSRVIGLLDLAEIISVDV